LAQVFDLVSLGNEREYLEVHVRARSTVHARAIDRARLSA
jgi:hypothetical protein